MDTGIGDLLPAFQEGFDAWEGGLYFSENPYSVGSREADEWTEGFSAARDESLYLESIEDTEWLDDFDSEFDEDDE